MKKRIIKSLEVIIKPWFFPPSIRRPDDMAEVGIQFYLEEDDVVWRQAVGTFWRDYRKKARTPQYRTKKAVNRLTWWLRKERGFILPWPLYKEMKDGILDFYKRLQNWPYEYISP